MTDRAGGLELSTEETSSTQHLSALNSISSRLAAFTFSSGDRTKILGSTPATSRAFCVHQDSSAPPSSRSLFFPSPAARTRTRAVPYDFFFAFNVVDIYHPHGLGLLVDEEKKKKKCSHHLCALTYYSIRMTRS